MREHIAPPKTIPKLDESFKLNAWRVKRFWKRINKNGPIPTHAPELGQCWVWTLRCSSGGYGQVSIDGKCRMAHRVSYALRHGEIPSGLFVLHKCDNPPCCNPAHLYAGTILQNAKDREERTKNFRPIGERHVNSKMTAEKVKELRKCRAETGMSFMRLGKLFGIHTMTAYAIVKGKAWAHIT